MSLIPAAPPPPRAYRMRLTDADLAHLIGAIDQVLPFPYDDNRWRRAPEARRRKYAPLRELRSRLMHPAARGPRDRGSWWWR